MQAMASTENADRIVDSIEQSFSRLFVLVRGNLREAAAMIDPDLQPAGWSVLRYVVRHPPAQSGAIVAATGMDKTAVSRQLKELRARGLVDAEHDAADGRVLLFTPTEEAERRVALVLEMWTGRFRSLLSTWEPADLETFSDLLERFVEDSPIPGGPRTS